MLSHVDLVNFLALPVGLGLLGFIEPCSLGSSVLFITYLQGHDSATRIKQVIVFTVTRAAVIGTLGIVAAVIGAVFITWQKAAWIVLGAIYIGLAVLYLAGKAGMVALPIGPNLFGGAATQGAVTLAVLFGLNIPACAAPLLFAVLGAAAVGSSGAWAPAVHGFVSLAIFGLALSLPLAVAILWTPARRALDRMSTVAARVPLLIAFVLVALGLWSMYFGLFVTPQS